jgi:hypothetical protein
VAGVEKAMEKALHLQNLGVYIQKGTRNFFGTQSAMSIFDYIACIGFEA